MKIHFRTMDIPENFKALLKTLLVIFLGIAVIGTLRLSRSGNVVTLPMRFHHATSVSVQRTTTSPVREKTSRGEDRLISHLDKLVKPPPRSFGRGGSLDKEGALTSKDITDIDRELKRRSNLLRLRCQRRNKTRVTATKLRYKDLQTGSYFVSRARKIAMCAPYKVAMSNWKLTFLSLAGTCTLNKTTCDAIEQGLYSQYEKGIYELGKDTLSKIGNDPQFRARYAEVTKIENSNLTGYTSWLQIRHPFERLVSLYRNKVIEEPSFRIFITSQRPRNWTKFPDIFSDIPSFAEFAQFIITAHKKDIEFTVANGYKIVIHNDFHVKPISEMCLPCDIKYNYIVSYKNIQREANFVLSAANVSQFGTFSSRAAAYTGKYEEAPAAYKDRTTSTTALMDQYFRTLSLDQITALYDIYRDDFELFGYV